MNSLIYKVAMILISISLISSCGKDRKLSIDEIDGVKYYRNSIEPSGNYKPTFSFLFRITGPENVPDSVKGFGYIENSLVDDNGYIYVLDSHHATIKKFDKSGVFERYFPEQTKGSGLDHLKRPDQFAFLYDTLIVFDQKAKKYARFLNNGSFINSSLKMMGGGMFLNVQSDGKDMLTAFVPETVLIDSVNYFQNSLYILDNRFKLKKKLRNIKEKYDENFFFPDVLTVYAARSDMVYISENKGTEYRIFAINGRGQLKYVIEKEHGSFTYDRSEVTELDLFVKASGFKGIDTTKVFFKKAINAIEIDKNNRLWVMPSAERDSINNDVNYIDIFDNGVYVGKTILDFVMPGETFMLRSDFLIVKEYDGKALRIYKYE